MQNQAKKIIVYQQRKQNESKYQRRNSKSINSKSKF